MVTRMGVSSFIVTLAGMLYFRGISMVVTSGATVAPLSQSPYRQFYRPAVAAGPGHHYFWWPVSATLRSSGSSELRRRRPA